MSDQYYILIRKLDRFIRKYYKNQLIKGAIYCVALFLVFFLVIDLTEYFGRFNVRTRTLLFYIYLVANAIVLIRYIIFPLIKLFRLGPVITHEEAASIIGSHFSGVSDKLLNTLQLKKLNGDHENNSELIMASIDQKISELKPVPFHKAIDFTINKKYIKYPAIPIIILAIILIVSPGMITEPTNRLVYHTDDFIEPLPFQVSIVNETLEVVQHDDFFLDVILEGEEIPNVVLLQTGQNRIKLSKETSVSFQHRFINVSDNIKFQLVAEDYLSETYELKVLPKPLILDFQASLDYPFYTGKPDEKVSNNGDFTVPAGTKITWQFSTKNTETVFMNFGKNNNILESDSPISFSFEDQFFSSTSYSISTSNKYLKNLDSLTYSIIVVQDVYPFITAEDHRDSIFDKRIYFKGVIKDDYGFNRLTFNLLDEEGSLSAIDTLDIIRDLKVQQFYHFADMSAYGIIPGQKLSFYFEVWDNDRINGSKSSKSQVLTLDIPSLKEVEKKKEESNENIKQEMEEAIDDIKKLQAEADEITKKLIDKKELSWEDKEQIKQMVNKQNELQNRLENLKNKNELKSLKEQQYKEVDEEILQKQQKLEELFEELMENEELKKLFEELQELLEESNKDKVNEMLEEMKMSNEEMEKMLDRNLELFKQLEFEQKLEETINKLEDLAKAQEDLSQETLDKSKEPEDLKEEQESLDSDFQDIKEDIEKLDELNNELEESNEFDKMEELQEEVEQNQEESKEQLDNNKRKKASESQKKASDKMSEMAQSMFQMQQDMIQEGMAEDMDALRDILENLIQLSFDQEDLIGKVNEVNVNDPAYTQLIQEQKKIRDDLQMVEDSLFALSKRQIMIEPFVNKEISTINQNIDKSLQNLNDRRTNQAAGKQQYVMTSVNNLALMLSETLDQMMAAMSMPSGSCKNPGMQNQGMPKPGQGQKSMKSMRQLQEQLNQQIKQMKAGKQKGDGKPGGMPNENGQSMSEQLARSAAQQEYIRNALQKMADELEKEGQFGAGKELKRIAEDMEKTETDLVNKMLTEETLLRQKQILTRLLKSEKAELEREKEEKRESTEGKSVFLRNPEDFFKYKKVQKSELELLQPVPATLTPFYKNKVNQYFFNFEELLEQ